MGRDPVHLCSTEAMGISASLRPHSFHEGARGMVDNGQRQAGEAPHVVIVGGGISGLTAAFLLRNEPVRVTVLDGASRLGGELAVSEVAGVAVDEGAEAVWRPKTAWLVTEA